MAEKVEIYKRKSVTTPRVTHTLTNEEQTNQQKQQLMRSNSK